MHIIILAGGGGTRLWPLSRQDFPKQFLHIGDQLSLLQRTVARFLDSPLTQTISISTNGQYAPLVKQQIEKIDPTNKTHLIIEPKRKNTAPAIAFSIKYLTENLNAQPNDLVLVIPSDHLIDPPTVLFHQLQEVEQTLHSKRLVLFGVYPTKPETGYGYIQIGSRYDQVTYNVQRFVEKPDASTAKSYCASGSYYWNTGMFAFSISHFWAEVSKNSPKIGELEHIRLKEAVEHFEGLPNISFDYAVLERSDKIVVCPLPVSWSDIGCWDSVYETMTKDLNQNVKIGNVLDIETKNSLIIGGKRLISTIGLDDVLIVETEDATFISKKGESQKVKQLVEELLKMGKKEASAHTFENFRWGKTHTLHLGKNYTIKKIEIDPFAEYQHTSLSEESLIPLSDNNSPIQLSVNSTILITNPKNEIAEMLLISRAISEK